MTSPNKKEMLDVIVRATYLYLLYHTYYDSGLLYCLAIVFIYFALFYWLPQLFGRVALSSADAFFLNDISTNRQYILGTSVYERLTRDEFLYIMRNRTFATVKRFSLRIVRMLGKPYWQREPDFSVDNHLKYVEKKVPNEAALYKFFEEYITEPMDFTKSLWEATFIENYQDDKSAIIIKAHHALCDGLSAVSLLVSLADPLTDSTSSFVNLHKKSILSDLPYFFISILYFPFAAVKQLLRRPDKSFIHGQKLTGNRSYWCSARIPIDIIKRYSNLKNVKFNTTLLACIGSGVQNLFKNHNESAEGFSLYVPVGMRNLPADNSMLEIKNNISYLMFRIPTNLSPTESRIDNMHSILEALKNSLDPLVNSFSMKLVAKILPMTVARPLIHSTGSQCSMLFTNVPGPNRTLYYCKKKLLNLFFNACGTGTCGIQLCGMSYDGGLTLGVASDKACLPDAKELLREIESELLKLEPEIARMEAEKTKKLTLS